MASSKNEMAKAKAMADLLRHQVFIGVEATAAQEAAAKVSSGGQQPRRERLLNVIGVMERDNAKSSGGAAKPRLLCITVKRNRKLRLHKVKVTGTVAEISKTWSMDDVKAIEFKEPTRFSLLLNHKYDFSSADAALVEGFVHMLVGFCNKYALKPPRYINTVSGMAGGSGAGGGGGGSGAPSMMGSSGTIRPKSVFNRAQQQQQQAMPPMPGFDPADPRLGDGGGGAGQGGRMRGGPGDQSALMRRMTKYVADHGGDVSALVPMGMQHFQQPQQQQPLAADDAAVADEEADEEADDVEEMLLDEAFMLSADELVGSFGWRAGVDAAQLESRLLLELHRLESENVRDMLSADTQVPKLITELDQAISHLEQMEEMLGFYRLELEAMDDDVRKIQMENESLKVEESNQQRLLSELERILKTITLSEDELQVLRNESLETTDGIERVERVAASLTRMLGTAAGGSGGLEAAHEKMKKYEFYSANFSTRVYDYLRVMFQFKIDGGTADGGGGGARAAVRGVRLIGGPEHVHRLMIKYAGLTLWLKEAKPSADKELQALYIQCMNTLYASQVKELVDSCRPVFFRYRHEASNPMAEFSFSAAGGAAAAGAGAGGGPASSGMPGGRRISLDGLSGAAHHVIASAVKGGSDFGGGPMLPPPAPGNDMQPAEAFAIALQNVVANVIAEQNFISDLFHYVPPAHTRAARRQPDGSNSTGGGGKTAKLGESPSFYNWVTHRLRPIELWDTPRTKLDSKDVVTQTVHFGSVKEVKSMLDLLFGSLVTQIDALVDMGTRFDPSQAIGMLVSVSRALDLCKGSDQGFLINVLERCNDKLESTFQSYVSEQARAIEATKLVTKRRVGVLPFARIFPKFIAHIEELVGDTGYTARAIADSAYSRISRLIFDTLESLLREAESNAQKNADDKDAQKEQLNTHVLLLENMFVLVAGLQTYRTHSCRPYFVPMLDTYLDHAQVVQRKVMRAYVKDVLGRPMGRLAEFFDAVERCLAANKDPMVVPALAKGQLKKVIGAHSNSGMRENLKQLAKRVEKHFIDEPKLRPVVWQAITNDVLSNYQRFVTLLARAYKSTNLSLDFTQSELKGWLSER
ncbi:hypothetical protein GGI21_000293 [Coemansia aciculifera]|nr:hypothetical protein GGI21_000293 [Coemansia aciculifera]